ncbi:MAG: NADH-quinone oxidoreductase subunit A [Chloroflexi bacterium]|nr:NADH-quinone oxidoreductase subunit A [Chloroflexota bacterium]
MPGEYAINYTAVLVAAGLGGGLVAFLFIISYLLAPHHYSEEKAISYECGMLPMGRFWSQIHVRYYIFAILFMIFDVETVFLYPWAVTFVSLGPAAFFEMVIFILVLLFGLAYAWKKGALAWR